MADWQRQTLYQALYTAARQWPDQEALVVEGHRLSFGQLWREAQRVASSLLAQGIRKGDHVAVCMGNSADWVILFFANALIGAVTVPVNTRFKIEELGYCLQQADVKVLIVVSRFLNIDFIQMLREVCPGLDGELPHPAIPHLQKVVVLGPDVPAGAMSMADFLAQGDDATVNAAASQVTPNDILLIQYTSGTTSYPKGAMLTHHNMLCDAAHVGERIGVVPGDRYYSARPFYHVAGTTLSILVALVGGACLISAPSFDAEGSLRIMQDERCTLVSGNETMFLMMMNHPNFRQYHLCLRGGWAAAGSEVMRRAMEEMGARHLVYAYGQSEASPNVTLSWWHEPAEVRASGLATPHDGVAVKIADPETGATLPPEQQGEICVRGWNVMKGYYNMPENTAKALDGEGWLHTGDNGFLTSDGRLRFIGRLKDMFRVGGENVAPAEVELVLHKHPKVKHAEVVGVPEPRLGEVPAAYVILREGATAEPQELIEWCRQRCANFKVPRYVRFVDTFDGIGMTGSFKVQKNKLRQYALEDLDLQEVRR